MAQELPEATPELVAKITGASSPMKTAVARRDLFSEDLDNGDILHNLIMRMIGGRAPDVERRGPQEPRRVDADPTFVKSLVEMGFPEERSK